MVKIKQKHIVLLGAPGSGKGTLARKLVNRYGLKHLSTGDMFRKVIAENSPLGQELKAIVATGSLVSDDITNAVVKTELLQLISNHEGFILDGYPRTVAQANFLASIVQPDLVFLIDVEKELAIKRIVGRRVCSKCGATYNIYFKKPKIDNVCDCDGEFLIQRKDDDRTTISKRFDLYQQVTSKLITYYHGTNKLYRIDANNGIEAILDTVIKIIEQN
ncbi:MAG: nucleoside monophosphate kinase [Mycoplasmataceae bacterium]|jgi:adenylate kinase|nr:nucleoside monophosphate kinase [Mycoplasmataceae bacterium]